MKTAPAVCRRPQPSERRRRVLWLGTGLVLACALLFAADREATRQQRLRLDAFRTQTVDLARISEAIVDAELRSLDEALLVLRKAYAGDPRQFADNLELMRSGPLADRDLLVVLVDRDGFLTLTDAPRATPRMYLGDRNYFRFFADGGKDGLYIDEPSLGRVTRRYTLPVVRPLYDERGDFLGVIAISLPQQTLLNFIPRLHLSGETTISIVNHGGAVVSPTRNPAEAQGKPLPPELLAPMLQGSEGVFSSRAAPDGVERIIAYRHIHFAQTPLIVSVESFPGEVLAETSLQRSILMAGAGFTSLIIMVLIVLYLKGRTTTARLIDSLRTSKKLEYDTLTRTSLDGFLIIDGSGRFLDANDTLCAWLGLPRGELLTLNIGDIEALESPKQLANRIRTIVEAGGDRFQSRWRRKDGAVIDVEISAQHLEGESGRLFAFVRDITERHRLAEEKVHLENQLRQAQKVEAIGRLAGGVAHDFNNLTAIILGYGGILLDLLPPEDPRRRHVEQIVAAGQRSAALTHQLLAFSRKQTLQLEVLDLNRLLRDFTPLLGRLIGEDIRLKFSLAADPGRVKADPGQLEQVITNLALNARDAMPLGGALTVETSDVELDEMYASRHESVVPGPYVMLALTDTGCGMDQAAMDRLFEPFFTTKPKGKGTGLGLATVYGIVKQSGGYIWVYSEPDHGATFKIYLPRTAAVVETKAGGDKEAAPRGGGELILLVEDEPSLRELCETVLTRLGYRVRAAGSGLEALALVKERGFQPDLVVTDVIMPGMSGAEMGEQLGRKHPGLKVLFMSGYPDETINPHGVLRSGTRFIQKPFSERSLALKVREVLMGTPADTQPGRRVLMIDDDGQYRELVRHFCTKRGFLFADADSGDRALAALAGGIFDVLLVDLNIPGTSGVGVLRKIRAAGHTAPAIVLTGDVAAANMEVLRPLGVVSALEKSSSAEPLLQAIEAAAPARREEPGEPRGNRVAMNEVVEPP